MTVRRNIAAIFATAALAAAGPAQNDASTLSRLCDRASWIAIVEVRSAPRSDDRDHWVRFAATESLRGSGPGEFTLREPCGHTCGRALHGLRPGTRYVAFLRASSTAPALLTSDARSLVPVSEPCLAHIRALLRTPAGDRVALLSAALTADAPRVRRDAAATLAQLTDLTSVTATDRDRLVAALDHAAATADPAVVALTRVAERLQIGAAVDVLVSRALSSDHPGLEPLLAAALPRIDAERAAQEIDRLIADRTSQRTAAVRLLAGLRTPAAHKALLRIARDSDKDFRNALRATGALLDQGIAPDLLERELSPRMVGAARKQRAATRPRYRSILRGQSR